MRAPVGLDARVLDDLARNHVGAAGVAAVLPWAHGFVRWWGAAAVFVGLVVAFSLAMSDRRTVRPSMALGSLVLLAGFPLLLRRIAIANGALPPWIGLAVGLAAAAVVVWTGYVPVLRDLARRPD